MQLRAFVIPILLSIVSVSCGSARRPPALSVDARRMLLNRAVAASKDSHDALLALRQIGDASSVPYLIQALDTQGGVPRVGPYLSIDTRVHCLDALQTITNQDAGRNADDWRKWYEANKSRSQRQWVLDGFAQHGFPVADPIDRAFAAALIRASDPQYRPSFIGTNALRLLKGMSIEALRPDLESLLTSPSTADRRASVAALEAQHGPGTIALLRRAAADADLDVAENGLRALNAELRRDPHPAPLKGWDVGLAKDGVHILARLDDRSVMLGIGYGVVEDTRVAGFDIVSRRILWTYKTEEAVRSPAVRLADRFYFLDDDWVLHCLSAQGKAFWTRRLVVEPDRYSAAPALVTAGGRIFAADRKTLYVISPDGQVQATPAPSGQQFNSSVAPFGDRVLAPIWNGPLLLVDGAGRTEPAGTALKARDLSESERAVCLIGFGPAHHVACLERASLRELWRADLPDDTAGYDEVLQDGDMVYVISQERALGFSLATGQRLWATNEFRSFGMFVPFGRFFLTRTLNSGEEWRDARSGAWVASSGNGWSTAHSRAVAFGDRILFETTGDDRAGLRMVPLPAVIAKR